MYTNSQKQQLKQNEDLNSNTRKTQNKNLSALTKQNSKQQSEAFRKQTPQKNPIPSQLCTQAHGKKPLGRASSCFQVSPPFLCDAHGLCSLVPSHNLRLWSSFPPNQRNLMNLWHAQLDAPLFYYCLLPHWLWRVGPELPAKPEWEHWCWGTQPPYPLQRPALQEACRTFLTNASVPFQHMVQFAREILNIPREALIQYMDLDIFLHHPYQTAPKCWTTKNAEDSGLHQL